MIRSERSKVSRSPSPKNLWTWERKCKSCSVPSDTKRPRSWTTFAMTKSKLRRRVKRIQLTTLSSVRKISCEGGSKWLLLLFWREFKGIGMSSSSTGRLIRRDLSKGTRIYCWTCSTNKTWRQDVPTCSSDSLLVPDLLRGPNTSRASSSTILMRQNFLLASKRQGFSTLPEKIAIVSKP